MLPVSKEELKKRLLALNDEKKPFHLIDGGSEADVIAEWKIVDAKWYEFFAKAGLSRTFQVFLTLNEDTHLVTTFDKEYDVQWSAGVPTISASAEMFIGQKAEKSFEATFGFREDGTFGKIYEYKFNTEELKRPLRAAVKEVGWQYGRFHPMGKIKKVLKVLGIIIGVLVLGFILLMIFV